MKKNFAAILVLVLSAWVVNLSAQSISKLDLRSRSLLQSGRTPGGTVHLLVKGDLKKIEALTNRFGGHYKYGHGNIASVDLPEKNLLEFSKDVAVRKIENPYAKGTLLMDTARVKNNIDSVQAGYPPLPHDVQGRNVIVGIIDGGIYFQQPDFKNPDGTTRILNIWDQTDTNGTAPNPYDYGSEWYASDINSGNCQEVEPYTGSCADYGHGTCVAGIASGNGSSVAGDPFLRGAYTGVAPLSNLIVVNIGSGGGCTGNFLPQLADAVDYIFKKADAYGMPCVINTSVGTYYGSHDGIDITSEMIDSLLEERNGRVLVAASGDGGGSAFHLGYDIPADSAYTFFNYNSSDGFVYFDWWSDTAQFNNAYFAIGCNDNTGNNLASTAYMSAHGDFVTIEDSTYEISRALYDASSSFLGTVNVQVTPDEGRYHFEVQVIPTNTNDWWRLQTTGSGHLDCWASSDFIGGSDIITTIANNTIQFPNYKLPDTLETMVSSWQNSNDVITVGEYDNRAGYLDVDSQYIDLTVSPYFEVPGQVDALSSIGPTRDNRLKPDISATGSTILCTGNAQDIQLKIANSQGYKVALGGMDIRNGGTSMASPIVAGIVALYFELRPTASFSEIKTVLINTAIKDSYTGPTANYSYGNGKVNAFQALTNNGLVFGATDTACFNYNVSANWDTGGCVPKVYGCTNPLAINYDSSANVNDGSCFIGNCYAHFTLYTDSSTPHHYYALNQALGTGPLSYSWNWGDNSQLDTGVTPTHTYIDSGSYMICLSITDSIGCTSSYCDSSTLLYTTSSYNTTVNVVTKLPNYTGLPQIGSGTYSLSVYPNPASTQLYIVPVNFHPQWITIYDMNGREITGQKYTPQLNISTLSSGMYFIEIRGDGNVMQGKRFVKL